MPGSTTSFLFPDINVWIALTYEGHIHHAIARRWFGSVGPTARLFFCRFTHLGLLRLLTAEAVMGRDEVMSQAAAWGAYDRWLKDERVGFLDEPVGLDASFRALTQSRQPASKDWADSYLAAFAGASQLTLVTFDGAFKAKATKLILLKA